MLDMKAKGSKGVARFTISLPGELAEQLKRMTEENPRSQTITFPHWAYSEAFSDSVPK